MYPHLIYTHLIYTPTCLGIYWQKGWEGFGGPRKETVFKELWGYYGDKLGDWGDALTAPAMCLGATQLAHTPLHKPSSYTPLTHRHIHILAHPLTHSLSTNILTHPFNTPTHTPSNTPSHTHTRPSRHRIGRHGEGCESAGGRFVDPPCLLTEY